MPSTMPWRRSCSGWWPVNVPGRVAVGTLPLGSVVRRRIPLPYFNGPLHRDLRCGARLETRNPFDKSLRAADLLALHLEDHVPGPESGLRCRAAGENLGEDNVPVLHRERDTETAP